MVDPERVAEITAGLVAIPTHEREQEAQEHLAGLLEDAGFRCELQEVEPGRPNLVARRGEGGTFLCSHIDVHPPHAHPDPFECRRQGELLIGRGAVDAKGQIAALVAALESDLQAPALVAVTCDEEGGGKGSELLRLPVGPWGEQGGVVLEPTSFAVCTAQTGHVDVSVEASAAPGHAYAPDPPSSPIQAVLEAADALRTLPALSGRHPLLPPPRLNLGTIRGGEHLWRSPARARAEVAVPITPGTRVEDVEKQVRDILDPVAEAWGQRGMSFLYELTDSSEPYEAPRDLPVASRLAAALGAEDGGAGMPSWTDAANLWSHHGIGCVIFGAGELAPAHSDHEWVRLADLVRLAEVLVRLLRTEPGVV